MESKDIYKDFINRYDVEYPDKWFEQEFKKFVGLDVYNEHFLYNKGYKIYKSNGHDILIIRLEDANNKLEKAIKEFLKIPKVSMGYCGVYKYRNVGNEFKKKYKDIKKMNFPLDFIDKNYNLKYVKHFYSNDEIKSFKKEWIND